MLYSIPRVSVPRHIWYSLTMGRHGDLPYNVEGTQSGLGTFLQHLAILLSGCKKKRIGWETAPTLVGVIVLVQTITHSSQASLLLHD